MVNKRIWQAFSVLVIFVILVTSKGISFVAATTTKCECPIYIQQQFGLKGDLANGKNMGPVLARNGFKRVYAPQVGVVVVMQPTFTGTDSTNGHVGVITSYSEDTKNNKWSFRLAQNCLPDPVGWGWYPKSWDNNIVTYWLPPDGTSGALIDTSKIYNITNLNSGKVLDVVGYNTEDTAWVSQWDRNGGTNQQIQFVQVDKKDNKNWYAIKFVFSGKYLVIKNASLELGAQVFQYTGMGSDNALWLLIPLPNGQYYLRNRNSNQMLAIAGSNISNNAALIQWEWLDIADQKWTFQEVE